MSRRDAWDLFKWEVTRVGLAPRKSLTLLLALLLAIFLNDLIALYNTPYLIWAVLGVETAAAIPVFFLAFESGRLWFLSYTIRWTLAAKDQTAVAYRLSVFGAHLRWYVAWHSEPIGESTFMLKAIRDDLTLPEDQRPQSLREVVGAVVMQLIEETAKEKPPWPAIGSLTAGITTAITGENPSIRLREILTEGYRQASSWYRHRIVEPKEGRFTAFMRAHPWLTTFIIALLQVIAGIIAFVLKS